MDSMIDCGFFGGAKRIDSVPRFTNNYAAFSFSTTGCRCEYEYDDDNDDDEPSNLHQLEIDSYAAFDVVVVFLLHTVKQINYIF